VSANSFQIDGATGHGSQRLILYPVVGEVQLDIAEIADAWSEAEAKQMHEGEDVIGKARCVCVMLFDPQIGFMVKQPVKDIGGVTDTDVDDFGAERRVLIRDVSIEELAWFSPILGIDMAGTFGPSSSLEALSV
jgi:hypothetical protein